MRDLSSRNDDGLGRVSRTLHIRNALRANVYQARLLRALQWDVDRRRKLEFPFYHDTVNNTIRSTTRLIVNILDYKSIY